MIHGNGIFTEKWTAKLSLVHFMRVSRVNRNEVQVEKRVSGVTGEIILRGEKDKSWISLSRYEAVFSEKNEFQTLRYWLEICRKRNWVEPHQANAAPIFIHYISVISMEGMFLSSHLRPPSPAFHEMLSGHSFLMESLICIQVSLLLLTGKKETNAMFC